jgi:hypothetical protein
MITASALKIRFIGNQIAAGAAAWPIAAPVSKPRVNHDAARFTQNKP